MNQLSQDAMTNDLNTTAEDVSADTAEEAQATATPKDDGKSAAQPTDAEKAARALQRRVDRLTAERHQDREELARLRNQKPAEKRAEEGEEAKQLTEEDVETRAEQKARELHEVELIVKRCNEVAELGKKESKEFLKAWSSVGEELGDVFDARNRPTAIMQAILDADEPHKLILHLAANLDVAGELADMTQTKRIRRIVQIEKEMGVTEQPKQSNAPKPVQPVKAGGGESEPDPKDTKRWIEWENQKLLAARRK